MNLATSSNHARSTQIDLFSWSREISGKPKYKKKLCADCQKVEVVLTFNPDTDRYEGKRRCYDCLSSLKNRYFPG